MSGIMSRRAAVDADSYPVCSVLQRALRRTV